MTSPGDFNHRLLSLEGPTLYYQTNLGALVAIEAATGSTLWVASYPRQEPSQFGNGGERDLNPAVVHDGRVFVAPSDADAIFAFDSQSGRLLWKTERIADDIKLTHVLGVAKGRLVATGNRVVLFDVKTGKLLHAWPDSGKVLDGYGRGLLAGDMIYWPTQNEIQILDQRTGLRAEPPIKLQETYHAKGRKPGRRRRLSDRRAGRRPGGLLPEQPPDRAVSRADRAVARGRRQLLPAGAGGRGDRPRLGWLSRCTERRSKRPRPTRAIDGLPLGGAARDQKFRLLIAAGGAGAEGRASGMRPRPSSMRPGSVARSDGERLAGPALAG